MNNSCNPSSPISSNQVTEVGLYKPRCADFQGNTLNDWLKWLADQQCKTDWNSFDLTCLMPYLQTPLDLCEKTEKTVIAAIIQGLCKALDTTTAENCCGELTTALTNLQASLTLVEESQALAEESIALATACCNGEIVTVPTEDPWITTRSIRSIKQGSIVNLQGAVTGTVLTNPIAYLPVGRRPLVDMIFPCATDIAPDGAYDIYIRIRTTGLVQIYVTGSAPLLLVARAVYLDGITFFVG